MQGHCDSTRVARDALVLGSGGIVSQDSTEASSSAQSPKATLQSQIPQESGVSESPCMVSGLLQEGQGGFSVEVADRIKAPQRESSRRVYDSRWAIFQKWAQENQVDVAKPTIPQIADFLNYLFTDKNLKPRTIAGYRTSVADGLGSAGQMVSQSLDLNRLIASFHRDRPSANRSIPNWDLSLVLLALTRPRLNLWQRLILRYRLLRQFSYWLWLLARGVAKFMLGLLIPSVGKGIGQKLPFHLQLLS